MKTLIKEKLENFKDLESIKRMNDEYRRLFLTFLRNERDIIEREITDDYENWEDQKEAKKLIKRNEKELKDIDKFLRSPIFR